MRYRGEETMLDRHYISYNIYWFHTSREKNKNANENVKEVTVISEKSVAPINKIANGNFGFDSSLFYTNQFSSYSGSYAAAA